MARRRGKLLSLILTVGILSTTFTGCSSSNNSTEDGVANISIWTSCRTRILQGCNRTI